MLGNNPLVVLLLGHVAGFERGELQGGTFLMGGLSDESSLIVTNVGVESSDQHEGLIDNLLDLVTVGFDASDTVEVEGLTTVSEEGN